jgi:single-stranded-DNA-specific exonuclease
MDSDILTQLLRARGVSIEQADAFLEPAYDRDTFDPYLLCDMDRAVSRILLALQNQEKIAIYADFDADGIPGAVVFHDFFKKIGYPHVEVYIPHRDLEGFGFHTDAVLGLQKRGVSLIITVDVGSVAHETVAYAENIGVNVIVTDHHECSDIPLPATAFVNPKRIQSDGSHYPFADLCGAGVAYKVVCALISEGKKRSLPEFLTIVDGWEKWLLDMVGIATIADMVPLVSENRAFAYFGLTVLQRSRRPGVKALCSVTKIKQEQISEDDIGYSIAPRINAASRMDSPRLAFDLFTTDSYNDAVRFAQMLEKLNTRRKALAGSITKQAKEKIRAHTGDSTDLNSLPAILVYGDYDWKPSLLGSVATSLVREYARPVFLWGREGTGVLKGSCRSDGSVHVLDVLTEAGDIILFSGGHHAAGGFAIPDDRAHEFSACLIAAHMRIMNKAMDKNTMQVSDALPAHILTLPLSLVNRSLHKILKRLSPFGMGNPRPILEIQECHIVSMRMFGKQKEHLEIILGSSETLNTLRAYTYFAPAAAVALAETQFVSQELFTVRGSLEENTFLNKNTIELRLSALQDITITT